MPATTTSRGRSAASPGGRAGTRGTGRKSPLRVVNELPPFTFDDEPGVDSAAARAEAERSPELTAAQLRRLMISEFRDWLGTRTNRNGRPFQPDTISAYADAAIALDAWMSREAIEEDFTACDTAMLNRFFAAYFAAHSQGGTNTKQRNLRHLFTWLERDHDHPHPYTDDLQRYSPAKNRPSTLAGSFITDLLEVTGSGRARGFEDARDHAIIRMLTEGVRRTELVQLQTNDLPVDVIAQPFVRVVPLKGARASVEGRIVPLAPATARALVAYLRARRGHRLAASPALWLGTRNRGALGGSGLYRMLIRRAGEAGYSPDVSPHKFRHTFANDWLEGGGAEGDLMRLMGWEDRSMLDLYAKDMQVQRAIQAKRRRGDLY
jgi:site-specific recombinase XerD